MILSGRSILSRAILTNLKDPAIQVQPCGVDVRLKSVLKWTGAGTLDFSNAQRMNATTEKLDFTPTNTSASIRLPQGSYIVEFHELLDTPLDVMGHVYSRSSLWRSGALIHAGVCDSGYRGAFGALLQVTNPHGVELHHDARIAQAVFHEMGEGVGEGYIGAYQGSAGI